MRVLRILRGMTGTALSFAVPWTVVGAGLAAAMALRYPNLPTRVDVFGVSLNLAAGGPVRRRARHFRRPHVRRGRCVSATISR